jgi:hypothetical protein
LAVGVEPQGCLEFVLAGEKSVHNCARDNCPGKNNKI